MASHEPPDRPFDDDDAEAEPWCNRLEIPERSRAPEIAQRRARREGFLAAEVLWESMLADYADYARRLRYK